ncbi:MAG TPA: hypothetical protein VK969_03055 [Acidimicrobiia bacterium]|nr:hypothetical protein [Acidimicrobiia bacterium]
MLARHGWKLRPSPRRGFTVLEASRDDATAPVVVALHDSDHALQLFRSGIHESMGRACDLVVLDFAELPLREQLQATPHPLAEMNALRAFCSNPHVRVIRQEDTSLERVIAYCESTGASLLILSADFASALAEDSTLTRRLFRGWFDVLMITEHLHDETASEPGSNQ